MLAGVLWWGRDNRISDAKPTQVNLLSDHSVKLLRLILPDRSKLQILH